MPDTKVRLYNGYDIKETEHITMAFEKAKAYLDSCGLADRIIVTEHSSATVAEAALALGCEPGMIAKTLSFLQGDQPVLILAEGMPPSIFTTRHIIYPIRPLDFKRNLIILLRKREISPRIKELR